jgi:hypothetical protein
MRLLERTAALDHSKSGSNLMKAKSVNSKKAKARLTKLKKSNENKRSYCWLLQKKGQI